MLCYIDLYCETSLLSLFYVYHVAFTMEDMNTTAVTEWLRSLKLDNATAICLTHGIDGFVFMALLEEEGGLDSLCI